MVPSTAGPADGLPLSITTERLLPGDQEFIMRQGTPNLVVWPISGNPSQHEEFLQRLQNSSYLHGDKRPNPATTRCLHDWCKQKDRNPTVGPVEDIINFLATLFSEGYQYCSLNSYRSAISATHAKVDGYTVGQHPLVVRKLKGAYNQRLPTARYSAFWDVGVVLHYLKNLGSNEELSLCWLTLKAAMLMALTRPSRSVDLSKLDICSCSFTDCRCYF